MTFKQTFMIRDLILLLAGAAAVPAMAQLNVSTALTPAQLVQDVLVGQGIVVSNVTYNGVPVTTPQAGSGSFSNGNSTNLGLSAGAILSSGLAESAAGPAGSAIDIVSDITGTGSDPDLLAITTGIEVHDRAVLEFDFIPSGDSLKFNYVFASEEHPGYDCAETVNDVFGFFLSGPDISGPYTNNAINIALVPNTDLPVSIGNIHGATPGCPAVNEEYYIDNLNQPYLVFGGFTTVLQARAQLTCGETYHIKLAIGDVGDGLYNSAVFLQAGSFQSNVLPIVTAATFYGDGTAAEGCLGGHFTIFRPPGVDSTYSVDFFLTGTATPGVDYTPLQSPAVIPAGQDSVVLPFEAFEDGITEGVETVILNVFFVNACGDTLSNSVVLAILDHPPMVLDSPSPVLLNCDQDSVPLYASVSGGFGNVTIFWGDSLYSDHLWVPGMESGTYTVSATDQCPRTASMEITVDSGCEVTIPNVITPNGDGHNDKFVVEGIEGRDNKVQIWDRWGKEVLNVNNYRNSFGANDLNDGVYFYAIRVMDKQYKGYLQVLGSK